MRDKRCRKLPTRSFDVGGESVVAWDARQDPCANPAIYHVGIDQGGGGVGGLLPLPGSIERVPFATKPGARFKVVVAGEEVHYASVAGAVGHIASRYRDAERAKSWGT